MEKDLTLKALDNEQLKYIMFSPSSYRNKKRIENIFYNCTPGITVLSGNRGVGKSTLINYYLDQYKTKNEYLFLKFNITNNNTFFRDIFTRLEKLNIEDMDLEVKQKIKKCMAELKEKILFSIVHQEISDKGHSLTKEYKDYSEASIKSPFKIFGFNWRISKNESDKNIDKYNTQIIKTKNYYKDEIQNELIGILNLLSNYYKIFFIIDELDKMDNPSFNNFILENKTFFLESDLPFFIIIDKEKCIDLQYSSSLMESMIRDFIHLSNLEWSEFIIIASRMNTDISVNELREHFYKTKGNFRKLISLQLSNKSNYQLYQQTEFLKAFLLFDHFMNIPYIKGLPVLIKDFVKDFLYEVLDIFLLIGPISKNNLDEIGEKYTDNKILHPVITKLKSELINLKNYEEITKSETITLREEISKYHEPKLLYYSYFDNKLNKYKIEKVDKSDLKDWKYYIEAQIDSIDFVCICKQTIDPDTRSINYISYHCNFFASNNYMNPTLYLNNDGIAWSHEAAHNKNYLIEYLENIGVFYVEIELDENVYNEDFFKSENNLIDLENKIREKYDAVL
ncbi:P-loop NTPase fold protein [Bacillus toyonensis]|uniref:P-loop NTPase fold protein n=1 Tax=Bacillus toyonensis TaxID=155322 RepID=UPI003D65CAF1